MLTIQKDGLGLFVVHDDWVSRPIEGTPFSEGDKVEVEQLDGLAVGVESFGAQKEVDIFLRCGKFEYSPKKSKDNFDFFSNYANDVRQAKSQYGLGRPSASDSKIQNTQPRMVSARPRP